MTDAEAAYREYREEMLRYFYRLTGDAALAEDLAQEVFARLLASSSEKEDVRAWLYAVGRNLVRDRARTREVRRGLEPKASLDPAALPEPDEAFERRRAVELVRRALGELTPRDAQLLIMRYEGYSRREIGRSLGVSENSVSTLAARALRKLADAYEEMDMEESAKGDPEGRSREDSG